MEFFRYRRRDAAVPEATIRDQVVASGPPDGREAFKAGLMQGRREERLRHRGHPMLALAVGVVAVAGAAVIALAAHEGSFSRGGAVVDQKLQAAASQAQTAGQTAAVQTGQAIRNAGATIQQKASDAGGQKP